MKFEMVPRLFGVLSVALVLGGSGSLAAEEPVSLAGFEWTMHAPRDEIRPQYAYVADRGKDHSGGLVIDSSGFEGAHGWWEATTPISGGEYYHFSVLRKTTEVAVPRRSVVARIQWSDAKGATCFTTKRA